MWINPIVEVLVWGTLIAITVVIGWLWYGLYCFYHP
jgi:hypothetical protein